MTYDGCIKIVDPNSSVSYNDSCNIYFNTSTYSWAIPYYSSYLITSASGAMFNYIGGNISEINYGGYLSGTSYTSTSTSNYIARMDAESIADDHSVTKMKNSGNGYLTQNTAGDDIVADTIYTAGDSDSGTFGYTLYDATAAYCVTQSDAEALDLYLDYEDCLLYASSTAETEMIFDQDSYISVTGEDADYAISMTFDEDYPTDWFTFSINGESADNVVFEKVSGGYVLSADELSCMEVAANNRDVTATTTFTTNYTEVYLYEIDEDTIGVAVDTDGDGTYETDLEDAPSSTLDLGDLDGDSEITVQDAYLCQCAFANAAAGKSGDGLTDAQRTAADVDGDGNITIQNAYIIQRYFASLVAGNAVTWEELIG
ncbi:MAG: dockerin type I repeat-containing protein [Ruminococcus sp.]|nr:dockerin type I repeat-containing protein [Ruminococcus sp.]